MTVLIVFASVLVGNVLLMATFLWWGARWVKAESPTFLRGLAVTVLIVVVTYTHAVGFFFLAQWVYEPVGNDEDPLLWYVILGSNLGIQILLDLAIIQKFVRTGFPRSLVPWLGTLLAQGVTIGLVYFVLVPFVFELYIVPSNSMSPTIRGWHKRAQCPHCGEEFLFASFPPDSPLHAQGIPFDEAGICTVCNKAGVADPSNKPLVEPDRVAVDKLTAPQRWDIVAYQFPPTPNMLALSRIVGLPGETLVIKNGFVWIDGKKLSLPAEMRALRYTTDLNLGKPIQGTEDAPLKLKSGEYALLSDHSEQSRDSRDWGPLSESAIVGVVTVRYWPWSRRKVFR